MPSTIVESPNEVRIWRIFKYCRDSFQRAGIRIEFPKDTDPRKTYKWRYLEGFSNKIDEWAISDEAACRIIDSIVEYATQRKQLSRGLSLLVSEQALEIGLKSIDRSEASLAAIVDRLKRDYKLVMGADPMGKEYPRAMPNIVKWYMRGILSKTYLTFSKKCHEAMTRLDGIERDMLPSGKELILARMAALKNIKAKNMMKIAMADDWREGL